MSSLGNFYTKICNMNRLEARCVDFYQAINLGNSQFNSKWYREFSAHHILKYTPIFQTAALTQHISKSCPNKQLIISVLVEDQEIFIRLYMPRLSTSH